MEYSCNRTAGRHRSHQKITQLRHADEKTCHENNQTDDCGNAHNSAGIGALLTAIPEFCSKRSMPETSLENVASQISALHFSDQNRRQLKLEPALKNFRLRPLRFQLAQDAVDFIFFFHLGKAVFHAGGF